MVNIPHHFKVRISQHLGYSRPRGVSPALLQIFNRNCTQMSSNEDIFGVTGQSVKTLLERCDKAFRATDFTDESAFSQFQQILGDVNRRTRTVSIADMNSAVWELYLKHCDALAKFVNVPNLQRKDVAAKWLGSLGESYVNISPSIPDSCVSDRLLLRDNFI